MGGGWDARGKKGRKWRFCVGGCSDVSWGIRDSLLLFNEGHPLIDGVEVVGLVAGMAGIGSCG